MKYTINDTEHRTETEMDTSNKRTSNDGIHISNKLKRKLAKAKQEW